MDIIDIMGMMDIMDIIESMDNLDITNWMAMARAVSALVTWFLSIVTSN